MLYQRKQTVLMSMPCYNQIKQDSYDQLMLMCVKFKDIYRPPSMILLREPQVPPFPIYLRGKPGKGKR
jgi:hypothetical protein